MKFSHNTDKKDNATDGAIKQQRDKLQQQAYDIQEQAKLIAELIYKEPVDEAEVVDIIQREELSKMHNAPRARL